MRWSSNKLSQSTHNFKIKKIKNLLLKSGYSPRSNNISVRISPEGTDASMHTINKLRKLIKQDEILTYHDFFFGVANTLNISKEDPVRWDLMLDKKNHKRYIDYLKREIELSKNIATSYCDNVLLKRIGVYKNLHSCSLAGKELPIPEYSHESVTGRTSIVKGVNFMTMKKSERKKLHSTNKDEVLVDIDVKSCEPSLYLKLLGKYNNNSNDVYEEIKNMLNLPDIPRDKFKRGVLSILYGANERTSKNILKCSFKDVKKIKEHFSIESLTALLNEQYEKNGYLYNYYGRPIFSNANPVNYWIQSSAVDFCSLAFGHLVERLKLKPCFFIHDSMTVSVHKSDLGDLLKLSDIYDPVSKLTINVETKLLSE